MPPAAVPCVGQYLNLFFTGGRRIAVLGFLIKGLHTAARDGSPFCLCWLKKDPPITNTAGGMKIAYLADRYSITLRAIEELSRALATSVFAFDLSAGPILTIL